jgi:hypothetical protein
VFATFPVALMLAVLLMAVDARAQAPAPAAKDPEVLKEKRGKLEVGTMLLGLVIVSSAGMIGLILMLGRRTRRLARQATPECSADELWFLRKPRSKLVARETPVEDRDPPEDE